MVLVTGATGLVGSHLLYELVKQGECVRAICRKTSSLDQVKTVFNYYPNGSDLFQKVEWFEADILDVYALNNAFKGVKIVYHCAAYVSFNPAKAKLLRRVNITGTANVVNAALAAQVDKLCYVSSVASLGNPKPGEYIDEQTPWNPQDKHNPYAISKYGAEMEVWRGVQEGLPATVVHPGVILGEGHWKSASGMVIPKIIKGIKRFPTGNLCLVDVLDVVRAMIILTQSDQVVNQNYVLVGANVSYQEFFSLVAKSANTKAPTKPINKVFFIALARLNYLLSTCFGTKRVLTVTLVKSMYKNDSYSSQKIIDNLNYTFTPLADTISRIVNRFTAENLEQQ